MPSKPLCGWREWVSLPSLGVELVKAKVDTGARTSAIHADKVEEFCRAGQLWVRFVIHPTQRSRRVEVNSEAPVIDQRTVRDSGGKTEIRYVVRTDLRIGTYQWPIELTLTSRDSMGFRMLVGRTAIRRRLLVDPGRSYLIGRKGK